MKIHFIGIGGIGVSALAQYYLSKGHQISGSDLVASEITNALKKKEAKIFIGQHKTKNVPRDVDSIIYSPAVKKNNPELIEGGRTSLMSYPEALGELTRKHFTIAVSGTHGKSTTTAMLGLLLVKAGLDPTVIVGTKLKEFSDSNCRVGKSKYLVIEADEHFASFLNYFPKIIVLTTLEPDHLDYYKNFKNYLEAFKEFISNLPKDGILVANKDDKTVQKIIEGGSASLRFYSVKQPEAEKLRKILKIPGQYNVSNALAALSVARVLRVPDKISFKALSEYRGSWRRFDIRKNGGLTIVSDYGHHPTEIRVTLRAARDKWPNREIWCVFQPHQYQRTFYLFPEFVKTLKEAPVDKLIVTDIYDVAGREKKKIKKQINSEKLIKTINKKWAIYLPQKEIINYLKKNLKGKEQILIFMGAGDIYKVDKEFK